MKNIAKANALINTLDFDGLVQALEKIDNCDMISMIIERMFEIDEDRAIEFEKNY